MGTLSCATSASGSRAGELEDEGAIMQAMGRVLAEERKHAKSTVGDSVVRR
jgi:hypothetical protein